MILTDSRLSPSIRRQPQKTLVTLLVACCCLLSTNSATAQSRGPQLKAVDVIWGFNGRVQPGQFNPLSILLDNQTEDAIDAAISLQQVTAGGKPLGAKYSEQTFIAATGRRWVQFYPYIGQDYQNEWQLTVYDGDKYVDHPIGKAFLQARAVAQKDTADEKAWPQVVLLGEDAVRNLPASVKFLPENIFPPYVSATVGLHTVFLDHEPDWELPRQQAFASWLKLGGQVHLLHDSRGEFPRFSGVLAELNQPLSRYNFGQGVVVRHAIRRSALTEQIVKAAVVNEVSKGRDPFLEDELGKQNQAAQGRGLNNLIPIDSWATNETLFRGMRDLTQPEHSWWLIFFLALCYIGLIFPGCFLISKQKDRDFLSTYGAIVGLAVLFSLLFLVIGRRGYDETTSLQTLAVARAEDNQHWDVFQWNTLFVTSGDTYSATTSDQQMVLSIADKDSKDDSKVTPGNNSEARMRIPPYSSQAFVSRRRVAAKPWNLQIANANVGSENLVTLRISPGKNFPVSKTTQYFVLYKRSIYEMRFNEKTKQLALYGARKRLATFCQPRFQFDPRFSWQPNTNEPDRRTEEEVFYDTSLPELVNRSLIDDLVDTAANFELPPDRIRLFVYTSVPEEFDVDVSASVKRFGHILFTKDMSLQAQSSPE